VTRFFSVIDRKNSLSPLIAKVHAPAVVGWKLRPAPAGRDISRAARVSLPLFDSHSILALTPFSKL